MASPSPFRFHLRTLSDEELERINAEREDLGGDPFLPYSDGAPFRFRDGAHPDERVIVRALEGYREDPVNSEIGPSEMRSILREAARRALKDRERWNPVLDLIPPFQAQCLLPADCRSDDLQVTEEIEAAGKRLIWWLSSDKTTHEDAVELLRFDSLILWQMVLMCFPGGPSESISRSYKNRVRRELERNRSDLDVQMIKHALGSDLLTEEVRTWIPNAILDLIREISPDELRRLHPNPMHLLLSRPAMARIADDEGFRLIIETLATERSQRRIDELYWQRLAEFLLDRDMRQPVTHLLSAVPEDRRPQLEQGFVEAIRADLSSTTAAVSISEELLSTLLGSGDQQAREELVALLPQIEVRRGWPQELPSANPAR